MFRSQTLEEITPTDAIATLIQRFVLCSCDATPPLVLLRIRFEQILDFVVRKLDLFLTFHRAVEIMRSELEWAFHPSAKSRHFSQQEEGRCATIGRAICNKKNTALHVNTARDRHARACRTWTCCTVLNRSPKRWRQSASDSLPPTSEPPPATNRQRPPSPPNSDSS